MSATATTRRLVELTPAHRVVSLYIDLAPDRFATPSARSSEITSLLDQAGREVDGDESLDHEQRMALREDIERLREYLADPPTEGARALAIFCSGRDELFETVKLDRSVPMRVVIAPRPYVEPLVQATHGHRWLVALASKRTARFLYGDGERFEEEQAVKDDVHGHHSQGGWSQANYQRSVEEEADKHFRRIAELLGESRRAQRFDRLALGGTAEDVARLRSLLDAETQSALVDTLAIEVEHATPAQVSEAMRELVEADARRHEHDALQRLEAGLAAGGHAVGGPEQTLAALNERRVETLLLAQEFDRDGGRCPSCGLLTEDEAARCPVDDTPVEPVALREATVESAVLQDADVLSISRHPDLGPFQGIAALTRF